MQSKNRQLQRGRYYSRTSIAASVRAVVHQNTKHFPRFSLPLFSVFFVVRPRDVMKRDWRQQHAALMYIFYIFTVEKLDVYGYFI